MNKFSSIFGQILHLFSKREFFETDSDSIVTRGKKKSQPDFQRTKKAVQMPDFLRGLNTNLSYFYFGQQCTALNSKFPVYMGIYISLLPIFNKSSHE